MGFTYKPGGATARVAELNDKNDEKYKLLLEVETDHANFLEKVFHSYFCNYRVIRERPIPDKGTRMDGFTEFFYIKPIHLLTEIPKLIRLVKVLYGAMELEIKVNLFEVHE